MATQKKDAMKWKYIGTFSVFEYLYYFPFASLLNIFTMNKSYKIYASGVRLS